MSCSFAARRGALLLSCPLGRFYETGLHASWLFDAGVGKEGPNRHKSVFQIRIRAQINMKSADKHDQKNVTGENTATVTLTLTAIVGGSTNSNKQEEQQ